LRILLIYPEYPDTFWSFRHALKIVNKKASFPPLGLATIAAMLPKEWEQKLVDMSVQPLTDKDIRWADYVFISAMVIQRESVNSIIPRIHRLGKKVVAGGPLFSMGYETYGVDHLVLGEGEITLPLFLKDLAAGNPRAVYNSDARPDITRTPIPDWSIINMKKYSSMVMQYSRGCPFDCEFCDIVLLNGHKPRTKTREQVLAELDAFYNLGWRAGVFIVDDNFIGNKKKLKEEILPAIINWQRERKYPFALSTEASINLSDDEELMDMMALANFNTVFIGIETPSEDGLIECNKNQNKGRDLVACVKNVQRHGMEVQGGFIVGFDSDPLSIFRSQINFIQNSGIVMAMVGLLNAPRGTRLYQRLMKENRIVENQDFSGSNTDCSINFIPRMKLETLVEGYQNILKNIYSPKEYYDRVCTFLKEYRPPKREGKWRPRFYHVRGFLGSIWYMGIVEKGRRYYWRFFFWTLLHYPRHFPYAITLTVCGYHFRKCFEMYIRMPVRDMFTAKNLTTN
jgi:radical SAM superfamily enzyme YgiQ (UPF0313 family)